MLNIDDSYLQFTWNSITQTVKTKLIWKNKPDWDNECFYNFLNLEEDLNKKFLPNFQQTFMTDEYFTNVYDRLKDINPAGLKRLDKTVVHPSGLLNPNEVSISWQASTNSIKHKRDKSETPVSVIHHIDQNYMENLSKQDSIAMTTKAIVLKDRDPSFDIFHHVEDTPAARIDDKKRE